VIDSALTLLLKIIYTVVALGILIFVHELGHFVVAKRAGIRVERFSLGYPPKMVGVMWGDTEYCISWIPFGGYVKVAGMADVGDDTATGAPWEYPSKPVWVRMAVIFAGPFMNFVFAFCLFTAIFSLFGVDTPHTTAIVPAVDSAGSAAGLRVGDAIVGVDGVAVDNEYELFRALSQTEGQGARVEVERGGSLLELELPPSEAPAYGLSTYYATTVGRVVAGMPADTLGLEEGDLITAVDGVAVQSWFDMSDIISQHQGDPILLAWVRDGRTMSDVITPVARFEGDQEVGRIGIGPLQAHTRARIGWLDATTLGAGNVYTSSYLILDFLSSLFEGEQYKQLGGPIRIMEMAAETAELGLDYFLNFLGLLSVNLAILNLLPIPVLDGGHLTFLALEAIRRRPLSLRQREVLQQVGLVIILCTMVLVTFNDLNQLVFRRLIELFQ